MLRGLFWLIVLGVLFVAAATVPLGKRTFIGHVRAIWATHEAQDMRQGIEEKAAPVVDRVKRGVAAGVNDTSSTSASRAPSVGAMRCLPLVAKPCSCTFSCGTGKPQADGSYIVHSNHWEGADITARIINYCVDDACTDVFSIDIICSNLCTPKAADTTCHFDADNHCVGNSP